MSGLSTTVFGVFLAIFGLSTAVFGVILPLFGLSTPLFGVFFAVLGLFLGVLRPIVAILSKSLASILFSRRLISTVFAVKSVLKPTKWAK